MCKEADIVINGKKLDFGQSATVRVAVSSMLLDLSDPEYMKDMGGIGPIYQKRLREIEKIILG